MLGETVICAGEAPVIGGRVAFVPQTAWIRNATVKGGLRYVYVCVWGWGVEMGVREVREVMVVEWVRIWCCFYPQTYM